MEKFAKDVYRLIGLKLSPRQLRAFRDYERELLTWNEKINLTAIREVEDIRTKHFLDSLSTLLELKDPAPTTLVDVGTGAGFPGIPLKIALPDLRLTLVESIGKKSEFCRHVVNQLQLDEVEVLTLRAEDVGQQSRYREQFDWAVARAVASLPVLAEYLLPLVRVGGALLAQKGGNAHAEVHAAERSIQLLGGSLRKLSLVTLPGVVDERYLVVVDKKAATPPIYPRRAGMPLKKPL
ncbi:MAG TPA: 16S rRNA (guanine(527)-N(7))-methyltransferase RsmG [Anaerolineaceae bacterium]|jgi:16S rRNA (guanine527-N7)-methyltransferase|nr:16S rRNA (guanine(527)-N(7))-methyltransferase RsmG [Anaerolineaceae bacterium]HQM54454.1 16S rRNA (guanine(527)-N(7))-methyltransferase RsmG [Anaerolineaceae bacterium]